MGSTFKTFTVAMALEKGVVGMDGGFDASSPIKVGGYTISDARGRGRHGLRGSGWEHASNIRLEVLCAPELAGQLVEHLRHRYEKDYAMTIWSQTVNR